MTKKETEIRNKLHRAFIIKTLCESQIKEIKNYIYERTLDLHYSDSWEQHAQITRNIEMLDYTIDILNGIVKKLGMARRLSLPEIKMMIRIKKYGVLCIKYDSPIGGY